MTYGGFAYGSLEAGGSPFIGCSPPRANLIIMEQLELFPGNIDLDKLSKSIDNLLRNISDNSTYWNVL